MTEPLEPSLQERYAPHNRCFGCGPANPAGLRIRSFATSEAPDAEIVADWMPGRRHEAFEGVLNGGIIGALLDCHANWTAALYLMRRDELDELPCTVTAAYEVAMKRPTSSNRPVHLSARVAAADGDKVTVEATLTSGDKVTATCRGTFVAVKPGHPAYFRW